MINRQAGDVWSGDEADHRGKNEGRTGQPIAEAPGLFGEVTSVSPHMECHEQQKTAIPERHQRQQAQIKQTPEADGHNHHHNSKTACENGHDCEEALFFEKLSLHGKGSGSKLAASFAASPRLIDKQNNQTTPALRPAVHKIKMINYGPLTILTFHGDLEVWLLVREKSLGV